MTGQCDVVEYHADQNGIPLSGIKGTWRPYPIEYKRGKPKTNAADELQLCGQAMCLEEMLCCDIPEGAIYYGEIRHRETVIFTKELRITVINLLEEMHQLYRKGYTPKVKTTKSCNACSLKEICLPKLMQTRNVESYLEEALEEF